MLKNRLKRFVPQGIIDSYHLALSLAGSIVYRFPSRHLKVLGITGTNGKTTTAELVAAILREAGFRVAQVSSVKFRLGEKEWENRLRMTMPGRLWLQRFLRKAVAAGCQYAILEVTSEGIKQHRHRFIKFQVAALTNLTPEHLEAHGSFEKYREAKGKLFQVAKNTHIINLDDENADYFLQFGAGEKWGYCLNSKVKSQKSKVQVKSQNLKIIQARDWDVSGQGISFGIAGVRFELGLLGKFNIYNGLCAIAIAQSQGIDLGTCRRALLKFRGVGGRMERVLEKPFQVFVDYAFTPNALRQVYQFLKPLCSTYAFQHFEHRGKLICVLGASGGGRDEWKRPVLGKLAGQFCDHVILTDEDSYDEDPWKIIEMIAKGCPAAKKIIDRREAIGRALRLAQEGDVVVITGKGSEPSIHTAGGVQIPWDDREVVKEEFRKLKTQGSNVKITSQSLKPPPYQILEHTTDLKIRAFGKTKEELFTNALRAMFAAAGYQAKVKNQKSKVKIEVESADANLLLVDFLSEAVYLSETRKEVYQRVKFANFSDTQLQATLVGQKLERMGIQIKGVTYHEVEVKQGQDGIWQTTVVFDI